MNDAENAKKWREYMMDKKAHLANQTFKKWQETHK